MATVRLTQQIIAKSPPRDKPFALFDADVKGFGVRVFPSGARSFILEYRPAGAGRSAGKSRVKLGDVGGMSIEACLSG